MKELRPFIYICAMPRTGSTILAESLVHYPECFIHNESMIAEGHYHWDQLELLPSCWNSKEKILGAVKNTTNMYIEAGTYLGFDKVDIQGIYRDGFVSIIKSEFNQAGIKEIYNSKWRDVLRVFPDAKTVITCRDPRDIYASIVHMRKKFSNNWEWASINGEQMASKILDNFRHQRQLMQERDHIVIRYEDFCTDPNVFDNLRTYVNLETDQPGEIACYNLNNSYKNWEHDYHEGKIGDRSIGRWRISDLDKYDFDMFCSCVHEYAKYFGY